VELNGLLYVDDINLLGENNINPIKNNIDLLQPSK